jgi:hypothetical protein
MGQDEQVINQFAQDAYQHAGQPSFEWGSSKSQELRIETNGWRRIGTIILNYARDLPPAAPAAHREVAAQILADYAQHGRVTGHGAREVGHTFALAQGALYFYLLPSRGNRRPYSR